MKNINRRSFMIGCGLLTFGSAGIFLNGCGSNSSKPIDISTIVGDKTIYLNQAKFDLLKSRSYVQHDNLLIFNVDDKFYAFTNICPHEQGILKIENRNTIRCQEHTNQTYDKNGIGNKAETIQNLKSATLSVEQLNIKAKV